jgi:hypothetical protein
MSLTDLNYTPESFTRVHFEFSDIDRDYSGLSFGSLWITVLRSDQIRPDGLELFSLKDVFIGYATPSQYSRAKKLFDFLSALETKPHFIQMNGTQGFVYHDFTNNKHIELGA